MPTKKGQKQKKKRQNTETRRETSLLRMQSHHTIIVNFCC